MRDGVGIVGTMFPAGNVMSAITLRIVSVNLLLTGYRYLKRKICHVSANIGHASE